MNRYTVYGNLAERDTVVLVTTLAAKGLEFELCEETSSLALPLAARTGDDVGPYLRTPEGFVLSGLHGMLDWVEGASPSPALLPDTPIRWSYGFRAGRGGPGQRSNGSAFIFIKPATCWDRIPVGRIGSSPRGSKAMC